MKRLLLFAVLLSMLYFPSFSQSDTTVRYLSKTGKETTKDSAFSYVKFYKHSDQWHAAEYYMQKGTLKSEGNYEQPNFDTPVGSFNNYKEDGKLDFTSEYVDGKLLEKIYYYKNGEKRSWIHYSDKEPPLQKGWDESGKEIKNYMVEREAMFKGGSEAWKRYLAKNVDPNLAVNVGAPAGKYEVQLQFVITTDGYTSNVR
jgi:antitoxin component YwqK of YwqJK toxin-antitoxin module